MVLSEQDDLVPVPMVSAAGRRRHSSRSSSSTPNSLPRWWALTEPPPQVRAMLADLAPRVEVLHHPEHAHAGFVADPAWQDEITAAVLKVWGRPRPAMTTSEALPAWPGQSC